MQVQNPTGRAILRARLTPVQAGGQVFAPIHWTGETAPSARIDALVPPVTDPVSGQPESKAARVALRRFDAAWYGFAVSVTAPAFDSAYWALARTTAGYRAELAGQTEPEDWVEEARRLLRAPGAEALSILDAARGRARVALYQEGRLLGALYVAREPVALLRDHLATLPGTEARQALAGRPPADQPDPGPVLCACFNVGVNTLVHAIETQQLMDVDAIGAALQAGSNCGSCRPELAALLNSLRQRQAAE